MSFANGKFQICASPDCESTDLTTVSESWDEQDEVFAGEQRCDKCGCSMLYQRRPSSPMEIERMKKKKSGTKSRQSAKSARAPKARRKTVVHRLNTHKPNGGLPASQEVAPEPVAIGEAVRRAIEDLGDTIIDESLAPSQLRELAGCLEHIVEEQTRYDKKSEEAKVAKKSLESAQAFLIERVKAFTHPTPMPLFDKVQAEEDEKDMLDAAHGQGEPKGEAASV